MERVTWGRVRRVQVRLHLLIIAYCTRAALCAAIMFACSIFDSGALQQTLADLQVLLSQLQPLHQPSPNCSRFINRLVLFILCLQAAAAARIIGQPDVFAAAGSSNGALLYLHLVADPDCVNVKSQGQTPLHRSIHDRRQENCRLLLQCNADVQARTEHFSSLFTPLHLSCDKGDLEICRLLLQWNADLEARDWRQWPLPLNILLCIIIYEPKLCMRDLILLFFFRQFTPLITCAYGVHYGWGKDDVWGKDDGQRPKTFVFWLSQKLTSPQGRGASAL